MTARLKFSVVAAVAAALAAPAQAAPTQTISLPWPPAVLPRTPPLSPRTSGVLPLQPRFLRRVFNRDLIIVGLDEDGSANAVTVVQTLRLNRLGDYVFAIPAPVVTVLPGPGTRSPPGQRTNEILWQGFSPGQRVLSARAILRPEDSAPFLPVKVRVEPHAGRTTVVIENRTAVGVPSYTGDVGPASLALTLARIRSAIGRGVFAEGLNVDLHGPKKPTSVEIAAPLRITGRVEAGRGPRRFSGTLDGTRTRALRVTVTGSEQPNVTFTVRTAAVPDRVKGNLSPRERLARTIELELGYARKRQFDQFLASPDPTGRSRAAYVYRTAAPRHDAAPAAPAGPDDHTVGWIALALVLAAGLPLAVFAWARS